MKIKIKNREIKEDEEMKNKKGENVVVKVEAYGKDGGRKGADIRKCCNA